MLSIVIGAIILFGAYHFLNSHYEEKLFNENAIETDCVVIEVSKGRIGFKSPKYGYYNKCQYYINSQIHYCQIFTSVKPLTFGEKIPVKYYQFTKGKKKGKILIDFSEETNLKYHEYGFNDYGY